MFLVCMGLAVLLKNVKSHAHKIGIKSVRWALNGEGGWYVCMHGKGFSEAIVNGLRMQLCINCAVQQQI